MVVELVAIWVVVSLAYLLQPVVTDDPTPVWEQMWWFSHEESTDESSRGAGGLGEEETTPTHRPITDGGRMCQNCGTVLSGDFTYCSECLTPVV